MINTLVSWILTPSDLGEERARTNVQIENVVEQSSDLLQAFASTVIIGFRSCQHT
jgi:hypothetical protein